MGRGTNSVLLQLKKKSAASLARALFKAELTEEEIASLPAQSLFLAVKTNGLESSLDVLEMMRPRQYRLLLDLEIWQKDRINIKNFWGWLSVIDDEQSLTPFKKFLSCVDLKIAALVIGRFTDVVVYEEPTESPPGVNYYSPDKGYTWIGINLTDPEEHRLLGKLLALVFEMNTELFYQLIAVSKTVVSAELEEESYQDRKRRLLDEGIPDYELAVGVNSALDPDTIVFSEIRSPAKRLQPLVNIVEPLVYEAFGIEPLHELVAAICGEGSIEWESFQSEVTVIMNSAVVFYGIDFCEYPQVMELTAKVRGALNIGLERLVLKSGRSVNELYHLLGLGKIYAVGLFELISLRKAARRIRKGTEKEGICEASILAVLETASENFPHLPAFFSEEGFLEDKPGKLKPGTRPFNYLKEIEAVRGLLDKSVN